MPKLDSTKEVPMSSASRGAEMQSLRLVLILTTGIGVAKVAMSQEKQSAKPATRPMVEMESIRGQWRLADDKLLRIVGKVKVIDARTLRFEDGTEADLGGGIDTPEIDQKGIIDGKLYACGKEA